MLLKLLLTPLMLVVSMEVPLGLSSLNEGRPPLQNRLWNLLVCCLDPSHLILVNGVLRNICDGNTHIRIRSLHVLHPLRMLEDVLSIQDSAPLNGEELAGTWILHMRDWYYEATHDIPRCAYLLGSVLHELGLNHSFICHLACL